MPCELLRASVVGRAMAPAQQLDTLVWDDLCQILAHSEMITQALERAQTGAWLPQEMQARRHTLQQAVQTLIHQEERLLEAYLAEVIGLPELERKRAELSQKKKALHQQQRQLEAQAQKHIEIASIAGSSNDFCQQIQAGLDQATFAQRRQLIELLVDCVIINEDQVEIRYVIPISAEGTKTRFCHLRTDYFNAPALPIHFQGPAAGLKTDDDDILVGPSPRRDIEHVPIDLPRFAQAAPMLGGPVVKAAADRLPGAGRRGDLGIFTDANGEGNLMLLQPAKPLPANELEK